MAVDKVCAICGLEKRPQKSNQSHKMKDGTIKVYNVIQWRCQKRHTRQKDKMKSMKYWQDNLTAY